MQNHNKVITYDDHKDATNNGEGNNRVSTKDWVTKSFHQLAEADPIDKNNYEKSATEETNNSDHNQLTNA